MKNKFLKFLAYALFLFLLTVSSMVIYLYSNESKIIELFVNEANKYLKTEISCSSIELDFLADFPNVSVVLHNVEIGESVLKSKRKVVIAEKIELGLDVKKLFRKKYSINKLKIKNALVDLKVFKDGTNNYSFLKEQSTNQTSKELEFNVRNFLLSNVDISYSNEKIIQSYKFFSYESVGEMNIKNDVFDVSIVSNLEVEHININSISLFSGREANLKTSFQIAENKFVLKSSTLQISDAFFRVSGKYNLSETSYKFEINAENSNVQTLLALAPKKYVQSFEKYKSKGKVYFNGVISHPGDKIMQPLMDFSFGSTNAEIIHPESNKKIEQLSFTGMYSNGNKRCDQTTILKLTDLRSVIDGNNIEGSIVYKDLKNPYLDCQLKGKIDVNYLSNYLSVTNIETNGDLSFDIMLDAYVADLKNGNSDKINSSGDIMLKNINVNFTDYQMNISDLNGNILFNKNDLAFSGISTIVNGSDIQLDGMLKNFFGYLFNRNKKLYLISQVNSNKINVDKLIKTSDEVSDSEQKTFNTNRKLINNLLNRIAFSLQLDCKQLHWGTFNFKNISGDLAFNNNLFKTNSIKSNLIGGSFELKGDFNAISPNNLIFKFSLESSNLLVDSLFYVLNDFNQSFISHKNLKGNVDMDIRSKVFLDSNFNVLTDKLVADVTLTGRNGKLIQFEPMQKLSKFIDESELANITFSELSNSFHIENEKVTIPEMEVKSSVSNIWIRGEHTFDQRIEYYLKVPLKKFKNRDKDEAFGAVEDDGLGNTMVFLKIIGTTDDYKIQYDKKATSNKIKESIKDEVQEIKDLIKGNFNTEDTKEQIQLEEDEYFDFDDVEKK